MPRKQKKTRAESSAEEFFPIEQHDVKYAVEKVEKILEPEIERIEKVGNLTARIPILKKMKEDRN